FYGGAFQDSVDHYERLRAHFDDAGRKDVLRGFGYDPVTAANCYLSWSQWCLGFPDRAVHEVERALVAAREVDNRYALVLALNFACALAMWRGEWDLAEPRNIQLRQISTEEGYSYFVGTATFFQGVIEAQAGSLDKSVALMSEGMEVLRSMDA